MSDGDRNDFKTRFKKGQSGNPAGRPKGRKNTASSLQEALLNTLRVRDGQGTREVYKIVASAEVSLNNALKGDLKSFAKVMDIAERFKLLDVASSRLQIIRLQRI